MAGKNRCSCIHGSDIYNEEINDFEKIALLGLKNSKASQSIIRRSNQGK
jgi:hypothetical protein